MLKENEIFSFELKILTKETEERNFEMIRAEDWEKRQRPAEDRAFDAMVSLVSDPCELCFEMIHMVHYAKQKVHPSVFEAWNPPHLFSEFWIQRQSQIAAITAQPPDERPSKVAVQHRDQSTQVELTKPVVPTAAVILPDEPSIVNSPAVNVPHRAIPGFRSILQCGANTLYGDTAFVGAANAASTTVTPTTARINRLFQDSTTGFTQYQVPEPSATPEAVSTGPSLLENSSTADRIHRMFQEISATSRRSLRSEDAENEPPAPLSIPTRTEMEQSAGLCKESHVDSVARPSLKETEAVSHSNQDYSATASSVQNVPPAKPNFSIFYDPLGLETSMQNPSSVPTFVPPASDQRPVPPHDTSTAVAHAVSVPTPVQNVPPAKPNFSIFYDPLGLETSMQNPSSVPTFVPPASDQRPVHPHDTSTAVAHAVPVPTPVISRPIEVQISSRDPRLRGKQSLAACSVVPSPIAQSDAVPSGTVLFDWLERNRNAMVDQNESILVARNSLAMHSPTIFFNRLFGQNADPSGK